MTKITARIETDEHGQHSIVFYKLVFDMKYIGMDRERLIAIRDAIDSYLKGKEV